MTINIDDLLTAEISSQEMASWTGELGGQTITLYSKPLSPIDFDILTRRGHANFLTQPTLSGMVEMIMQKSVGEDGRRIFSPNKHRPLFAKVNQTKIAEMFSALFGDSAVSEDEEQFEARVGNSGMTRSG